MKYNSPFSHRITRNIYELLASYTTYSQLGIPTEATYSQPGKRITRHMPVFVLSNYVQSKRIYAVFLVKTGEIIRK